MVFGELLNVIEDVGYGFLNGASGALGAMATNAAVDRFSGRGSGGRRRPNRRNRPGRRRGGRRRRGRRSRAIAFDTHFEISSLAEGSLARLELEQEMRNKAEAEARRLADDEERMAELEASDHSVLLVEDVELHVEENGRQHHTDLFAATDDDQLVVRRGQEFTMTLTFQRPFVPRDDDMKLVFELGPRATARYGTRHELKLVEEITADKAPAGPEWRARITSSAGPRLTVAVYVPADAIVGEWELSVVTVRGEAEREYVYLGAGDVIVLFNPWCPHDQVYYKGDKVDLNEYILNESGAKFQGTFSSIKITPWTYGQFQEDILEVCLHLLRRANKKASARNMSDPVLAARSLAWVVGNQVVAGNWSHRPRDFQDGTQPDQWHGSVAILLKYAETKSAVKYGQSWVFSHVLTTVCRALGLPCRSVTNYQSCWDQDQSMTRDIYVDADGELVDAQDPRWNFHVWNDVWMARPDLDKQFAVKGKYDGWQAVDATPGERGASSNQRGPAPLVAVKEGEVEVGQDTKSVFAEVNADVCTWLHALPPVLLDVDTAAVGKKMSTKFPDGKPFKVSFAELSDKIRMDVTGDYKYAEGSIAERDVVRKAVGQGSMADCVYKNESGVTVKIDNDDTDVAVGEKVPLKITLSNSSAELRTVQLKLKVRPSNYWGGIIGDQVIAVISEEKQIQPNSDEALFFSIPARDYLRHCDQSMSLRVLVQCHVTGCDTPLFTSDVVNVTLPDLTVTGPATVEPEAEFKVTIQIENPLLGDQMRRCWLKLDGDQIYPVDNFVMKDSCYLLPVGDINPGERKSMEVKVKATELPRRSMTRTLDVGLVSSLLPNLSGSLTLKLATGLA